MHRRDFLKSDVQAAAVGAAVAVATPPNSAAGTAGLAGSAHAAAVLKSYTAEDHRRRLQSIGVCQASIRVCLRKHLVTSYLTAQCVCNLGEYPCRKPYDPDEYDERELDRLKDQGIQLIQVMDDWNDQLRLCGGHKLTALNPDGFRRFVAMIHQRGMKILAYASSGYFIRFDPDSRKVWSRLGDLPARPRDALPAGLSYHTPGRIGRRLRFGDRSGILTS